MRHYSSTYKFFGAIPSGQLVVRMISSVYNYDYIQDLELKVDGTISVKVYTTGYAQTGPAMPDYPHHYGYPLFHDVSGEQSGRLTTIVCCVLGNDPKAGNLQTVFVFVGKGAAA